MNLAKHARRELELVGEEPAVIDWYVSVVNAYAAFGHSGTSAEHTLRVLERLLSYQNLTPLTNNPAEWVDVSEMSGVPMWQNIRNSQAFSINHGDTYKLVSENNDVEHSTLKYS